MSRTVVLRTGPYAFLVPGTLTAISGGSLYNRHLVDGLRASGHEVTVVQASGSFPCPSTAAVAAVDAALTSLPDDTITVVDGLIYGVIPEVAARHAGRLRFVALVHLPLAADPSAPAAAIGDLRASEAHALSHAAHVVITGERTRAMLAGYGVPSDRITVIEPGTDRPSADALATAGARRARPHGSVRLLTVGTLNPIKGHDRLLRTLARVDAPWDLTCAGSLDADAATSNAVRSLAGDLGLATRVTFTGTLTDAALDQAYADADVFVLPTRMETYGMAVAEALAWGLPVVATDTGAIARLVGEAGVVIPVDDDGALERALTTVLTDTSRRSALAGHARESAGRLPAWHDQVRAFTDLLDTL